MEKIRIGINGFGRIGRYVSRLILNSPDLELVQVNDLSDIETCAHLLKYDSVHGKLNKTVEIKDKSLICNSQTILFTSQKDIQSLNWKAQNVDIVIECTGIFRTQKDCEVHLRNGARKVIISAPASDGLVKTVCIGINDSIITEEDRIISNASCTTNSAAPLVKILHDLAEIESCYITTVHSYTSDQRLHDAAHKDLRRARAAAESIVPTTTGAAKAITKIFPDLENKMGGCGIRVPVPDGSLTDMTFIVKNEISVEQINQAFKKASEGDLKGILRYETDPIVSIDIIGDPNSCIFDSQLTSVIGNMIKVVGWYDNESGYSNRIIDLIRKIG
ncbi:MAG: type I glyceraldehyde-3-phosphate dehydrogenase [Crocinitomicaceae bacterium]|nr:type I glyceraldehyde-3-phosphate dehydrogenase [Crocinitomicaceae bacterium]